MCKCHTVISARPHQKINNIGRLCKQLIMTQIHIYCYEATSHGRSKWQHRKKLGGVVKKTDNVLKGRQTEWMVKQTLRTRRLFVSQAVIFSKTSSCSTSEPSIHSSQSCWESSVRATYHLKH